MAVSAATGAPTPRRRYRSGLREQQAEQTRRAVVAAAQDLFFANGYSATGMREVAAAAGVALETVYSRFSSKRGLLMAVVDTATVGDDAEVPLAERPEFLALGRGGRAARLRAAAALMTGIHRRNSAIVTVVRQGAASDPELAELYRSLRERQRLDVGRGLELVLGRQPEPEERDGVWAIVSAELYLMLTEESGWTPEQYEAWLELTLERVVPRA